MSSLLSDQNNQFSTPPPAITPLPPSIQRYDSLVIAVETVEVLLPPPLGDAGDCGEIRAVGIPEYPRYSGDQITTLAVPAEAYFHHAAELLGRRRPTPGYHHQQRPQDPPENTADMVADTVTGIATYHIPRSKEHLDPSRRPVKPYSTLSAPIPPPPLLFPTTTFMPL